MVGIVQDRTLEGLHDAEELVRVLVPEGDPFLVGPEEGFEGGSGPAERAALVGFRPLAGQTGEADGLFAVGVAKEAGPPVPVREQDDFKPMGEWR